MSAARFIAPKWTGSASISGKYGVMSNRSKPGAAASRENRGKAAIRQCSCSNRQLILILEHPSQQRDQVKVSIKRSLKASIFCACLLGWAGASAFAQSVSSPTAFISGWIRLMNRAGMCLACDPKLIVFLPDMEYRTIWLKICSPACMLKAGIA